MTCIDKEVVRAAGRQDLSLVWSKRAWRRQGTIRPQGMITYKLDGIVFSVSTILKTFSGIRVLQTVSVT